LLVAFDVEEFAHEPSKPGHVDYASGSRCAGARSSGIT